LAIGADLIMFSPVPVPRERRFEPLIRVLDGMPPGLFGYHPRWERYYYRTWPPGVAVAAAGAALISVGVYLQRRRPGKPTIARVAVTAVMAAACVRGTRARQAEAAMNGDTTRPDLTDPDESTGLDAAIEDVFDRLMTLDAAMGALADSEIGMMQALHHAEAIADAYRDRPERAVALRQLDELRDVAYRTLDVLVRESPLAADAIDGPPARGSSPQLVAPSRARRDTLADSPHALRAVPALTPRSQRPPSATLPARVRVAHVNTRTPDEEDVL
jgi:hypothetical protein